MERRTFVGSSVAALGATMSANGGEAAEPLERFLLRTYTLKKAKLPILDEYLSKAFIPAAKRMGCGPVGVVARFLAVVALGPRTN